ncbi:hypothetical protein MLD38_032826 [Melastoma candidum]|uniref:Uncharacterized protein n=1 Tax=Melastoma candidum TaxID=119954 RepID=A0ACB9M6M2_9MYRT|nr:hypothetical protein MLD38_032826 [Melastoma candidum]
MYFIIQAGVRSSWVKYTEGLTPTRVLDTPPLDIPRGIGALPCENVGSDHLALLTEFAFTENFPAPEGIRDMQRLVDDAIGAAKESVKTITYESLNGIVRVINGVSAILLTVLPGKSRILEGIHGWELRPSFRGPRFPRWMENGVSSFNKLVHELSIDSDASSSVYCSSDEEFSDGNIYPFSPLSQSSRASRASPFGRNDRERAGWIGLIFSWILLPAYIPSAILFRLFYIPYFSARSSSDSGNQNTHVRAVRRLHNNIRDNIIHRTTDRRRGVIEDLHLAVEVLIEALFDIVRKMAISLFSPVDAIRKLWSWFLPFNDGSSCSCNDITVPADSCDSDMPLYHSLNTDARTCQDVITELGYPYEAIHVITRDGYILLLERIPRRDAQKAVYLQHGILDSSMGWVSNGVVGSPAFAAYDQGYDVFLGNLRGLVSREHVNKNISSQQYWGYSINEHGTEDIPAMIEKIHQIKTSELTLSQPNITEETNQEHLYKLCTVCHSLGGAAMLMYVITQKMEEKPHRLSRLILLSPAGYHHDSNLVFTFMEHLFLMSAPVLAPFIPAFYIPTRFFRMLLNKLARDFHNYPAIGGVVQTLMSYVVGGDSSNWVGILGLPHYNMNDMPGVSFPVALHLAQMKRAGKFMMYDYGSSSANMVAYGSSEPLDLGEYYGFIDVPVDLVAGKKDKVIHPSMVRKHYKLMKQSDVDVSYNEFEYAHLDFTFSHHEELLDYVMSRVKMVDPSPKRQLSRKGTKSRRKERGNSRNTY